MEKECNFYLADKSEPVASAVCENKGACPVLSVAAGLDLQWNVVNDGVRRHIFFNGFQEIDADSLGLYFQNVCARCAKKVR